MTFFDFSFRAKEQAKDSVHVSLNTLNTELVEK